MERAGTHIGYYLEWAYKKGFAPSNPETHDVAEYRKVAISEIISRYQINFDNNVLK